MSKTKIVIAGIGAVGGYFGGFLAKHFQESDQVSVCFFARGENLKQIQAQGLKVKKGIDEFIAKPSIATDHAENIGVADFIIVSTKTYDLQAMITQLKPCISKDTVIIPLLNGVDSKEKIQAMLPDNLVTDGCVYIVSRLTAPGLVENKGNIQKLFFGLNNSSDKRLELIEKYMKAAGIEATLSSSISSVIWEKFIFISPTASTTSYFNVPFGVMIGDAGKYKVLQDLIEEIKSVAKAKNISIAPDITERTLNIAKALPYETTSSMHTDLLNDKPVTEVESLVGFIIREAKKHGLPVPVYERVYKGIKERANITS